MPSNHRGCVAWAFALTAAPVLVWATAACEPARDLRFGSGGSGPAASSTTTSAATTTSDTTTSTTSTSSAGGAGAGGAGGSMPCTLQPLACNVLFHDQCLCRGCEAATCTDGEGHGLADCVCPVCAGDPYCADPLNCDHDGSCDPFNERCDCPDCAAHPLCGG